MEIRAAFDSKKRRFNHSVAMIKKNVTPVIERMKDKVNQASIFPAVAFIGLSQVANKMNEDISKVIGVVGAVIGYYLSDKNPDSNKGKLVTAAGSFALGLVAHGVVNYFGLPEIAADLALPLCVGLGMGVLAETILPISSLKN